MFWIIASLEYNIKGSMLYIISEKEIGPLLGGN
jgi:hypothetical protein